MANSFGEHAAAVWWTGGTVKVVSSTFLDSSGFWLVNSTMDFVNSAFQRYGFDIQTSATTSSLRSGATLNSEASTFYWESIGCTNCNVTRGSGSGATKGLGFVGYQNTGLRVGVRALSRARPLGASTRLEPLQTLWGDPAVFSSGRLHLGSAHHGPGRRRTGGDPAERLDGDAWADHRNSARDVARRNGSPSSRACWSRRCRMPEIGGGNELFNPIDGLPIDDGCQRNSPRVYANGTRNIGAVQNRDAPILSATPGDSQVTLNWSPTPDRASVGL